MKIVGVHRYIVVGLLSFFFGFVLLHPFSMFIQGLTSPASKVNLHGFTDAFDVQHLTMAFFFGLLGLTAGTAGIFLFDALLREKERVRVLESFLPICAYCKKIRDDAGKTDEKGSWVEIEQYISLQTDTDFSHGICPECIHKQFPDIADQILAKGKHK
jgi:hypothetical protein